MQEETTAASAKSRQPGSEEAIAAKLKEVQHVYYEVGKELLSKPNALCDLLEAEGLPSTMVFCNSPSDADFVDVMLRKRGIASQKLIGFVPKQKLDQAILDFKTGSLTVLVVTDIGARGIDQSNVDTIINYSVPADTDLYTQRTGMFSSASDEDESTQRAAPAEFKLRRIASLISALDIGNFHYLRKANDFDFTEGQIPQSEKVSEGKYLQLKRLAADHTASELCQKMAERVLADGDRDKIVTLLVSNTIEVLPSLRALVGRDEVRDDGDYEDDEDNIGQRQIRGDRNEGRDRGGRDRGNRGRDSRNDRDSRQGRNQRNAHRDDSRRDQEPRDDQGDDSYNEGRDRKNREPRQRREQRPYVPPAKEVRLYIGSGTKNAFSKEKLVSLLSEKCELNEDSIKRFSSRPSYSFFDVAEEHADAIADKLGDASEIFVKKAITLSVAREQPAGDENTEGSAPEQEFHDDGGDDFQDDSSPQYSDDELSAEEQ